MGKICRFTDVPVCKNLPIYADFKSAKSDRQFGTALLYDSIYSRIETMKNWEITDQELCIASETLKASIHLFDRDSTIPRVFSASHIYDDISIEIYAEKGKSEKLREDISVYRNFHNKGIIKNNSPISLRIHS